MTGPTDPPRLRYRRWLVTLGVTLIVGTGAGVGFFLIAFRPPLSAKKVDQLIARWDSMVEPVDSGGRVDVSPRLESLAKDLRRTIAAWEATNGLRFERLDFDVLPPADDPLWDELEATFRPTLQALDSLPMNGRVPPEPLEAVPTGVEDLGPFLNLARVWSISCERHGRQHELVPLANRFLPLVAVRDREVIYAHLSTSGLILELTSFVAPGIPVAQPEDLARLRERLRRSSASMSELDRCFARHARFDVRQIREFMKPDATEYREATNALERSHRYLKYQASTVAHRWSRLLELPRDRGWSHLAQAAEAYVRSVEADRGDWRLRLANAFWVNFAAVVEMQAKLRVEISAVRVAVIAEQHRRQFGAYPETLEAIRGELEIEPDLLPFYDPIRLARSDGKLIVRIDSAVHPTILELSTSP